MKSFEGSFRNLNFSPSTSILLNFFVPFIDITCFFSCFKLQYCRTIVLLNKLKLKETSFSKATMVMRFPTNKNAGCPKALRDFSPRKDGILHPPLGCLGTPLLLPQSLYGRTGVRWRLTIGLSVNRLEFPAFNNSRRAETSSYGRRLINKSSDAFVFVVFYLTRKYYIMFRKFED